MTGQNESIPVRVQVVESDERPRTGVIPCRIGHHIEFRTAELESYCLANWKRVVFDVLLLVAVVDFCDRIAARPKSGWGRLFQIGLAVREPDRWNGARTELIDTLEFLTGDRWQIRFRRRRSATPEPRQGKFDLRDQSSGILPFSDGLDSRIVGGLMERSGKRLVRVRFGSKKVQRSRTSGEELPFTCVPYRVRLREHRSRESSARSRGFKFAMLSAVAAHLTHASEIVMPESGQGALGPALVPVGHAYEDYRNHPLFTERVGRFIFALLGCRVDFLFPRLWYTKGETLKEYIAAGNGTWSDTRSCWQDNRHMSIDKRRRQCGVCAACMLRRLSVHAAGLVEKQETYMWESLSAERFEDGAAQGFDPNKRALREHAIAGTLHMDHLAQLPRSPAHARMLRRNARKLAKREGLSPQEAEGRLDRLLRQHASEWRSFMQSLGPASFVSNWSCPE